MALWNLRAGSELDGPSLPNGLGLISRCGNISLSIITGVLLAIIKVSVAAFFKLYIDAVDCPMGGNVLFSLVVNGDSPGTFLWVVLPDVAHDLMKVLFLGVDP